MTRFDEFIGSILVVIYLLFVTTWFIALFAIPAKSQNHHQRGHSEYLQWQSGKTVNCCGGQDCGTLEAGEWADDRFGAWVRIEGQWCPVLRQHYLTRGKSPDWNVAHACISKNTDTPPCERLLCFTGKGGF